MRGRWDFTDRDVPLLAKDGVFYVSYLPTGGAITIKTVPQGLPYHWFDPRAGEFRDTGETPAARRFTAPDGEPWVLLVGAGLAAGPPRHVRVRALYDRSAA